MATTRSTSKHSPAGTTVKKRVRIKNPIRIRVHRSGEAARFRTTAPRLLNNG